MIKLLLFTAFIIISCTSTKTYIQNAAITSLFDSSPIRITDTLDSNSVVVRPALFINNMEEIGINDGNHTKVNDNGIYQVEPVENEDYYQEVDGANIYEYQGNNIIWTVPGQKVGLEVQFNVEKFAYMAGFSYAKAMNRNYWSVNAGLSYYRFYQSWAWRFDINFYLYEVSYEVHYVNKKDLMFSNDFEITFHQNSGIDSYLHPDISIVLNTKNNIWPVNLFLGTNIGIQTLYDFANDDKDAKSVTYKNSYSNVSFGLYRYVLRNCRALFGFRWNYHSEKNDNRNHVEYIFQLDFLFLKHK